MTTLPTPSICLLASSLEPGKDGVGDYTMALAIRLKSLGARVCCLAVRDRHLAPNFQEEDRDGIPILRLSPRHWDENDLGAARDFLTKHDVCWISLQLSPYGYEWRAHLLRTPARLKGLLAGRQLHIMFHETWIGAVRGSPVKERLEGWLQRLLVKRLVRKLKPAVMHTSNPAYQVLLADARIHAGVLPLISNIAVWSGSENEQRIEGCKAALASLCSGAQPLSVGLFAAIHPVWDWRLPLQLLSQAAERMQRRLVVVQIGRPGKAGEVIWQQIEREANDHWSTLTLGPLEPEQLSAWFQTLDFGLPTSPYALIGKSSSAIAMLEHGLPLLISRTDWRLNTGATPDPTPHPLLHKLTPDLSEALANGAIARIKPSPLPCPGAMLLADLGAASEAAKSGVQR